ncbi:hypothetical protein [Natranaerofaba carboxydovora]|nr:hypothetical protein [Natranaerofaba carboxydovora]
MKKESNEKLLLEEIKQLRNEIVEMADKKYINDPEMIKKKPGGRFKIKCL